MRIREASEKTGLTVSNIRFYEKKGLLAPAREQESKYRDYNEGDIFRLQQIVLYRKMDLSVECISEILENKRTLDEALQKQLENLKEKKEQLDSMIHLCQEVQKDSSIDEEHLAYYLNYVKEEEEKGSRFGLVEEVLTDYAAVLRYEELFHPLFTCYSGKLQPLDRILRMIWGFLWISCPVLLLMVWGIDGELSAVKIVLCVVYAYCMWMMPVLQRKREKEDRYTG